MADWQFGIEVSKPDSEFRNMEFLGPISPSDTEQLVRLRGVVREYLTVDPASDVTRWCELGRELEQLVGIEAEMKGEHL